MKPQKKSAFTLVEILIASTIFGIAVAITLATFITMTKQAQLLGNMADSSLHLWYATRTTYQKIVSSPAKPIIYADSSATTLATAQVAGGDTTYSGLCMRIPVPQHHYIMVAGGTDILDQATNTLGYNNTRTTIAFATIDPQATTHKLLADGATCPSSSISTFSPSIFNPNLINPPASSQLNVSTFFSVNDIIQIPTTGFGSSTQGTVQTVNSVSNSITLSAALSSQAGWGLPNGALITATSPVTARIVIMSASSGSLNKGDLVVYNNDSDLTKYTVVARNVLPQNIYADPSNQATSPLDAYPFTYNETTGEMLINLQCLPSANIVSGRATVGQRMRIQIRTNVTQPQTINNI